MMSIREYMFRDVELSLYLVVAGALFGAVAGLAAAALVYRARFTAVLGIRAAVLGGVGLLGATAVASWGEAHSAFSNGVRAAVGPGGEDLRLRNWLAVHRLALSLVGGAGGGIMGGLRLRRLRGQGDARAQTTSSLESLEGDSPEETGGG